MKLLFPLILITFFTLSHYMFYKRVLKRLHFRENTQRYLRWFLILNALGIVSYIFTRYFLYLPKPVYFLSSLTIGVGFLLFVFWILYELLHLLQHRITPDKGRREFFKKTTDAGFVAAGAVYVGSGIAQGSKEPVVKKVRLEQNLFTTPLHIVQISDMHIGGLIDEPFVRKSVDTINALKPDIVAVTGDLTDMPIHKIAKAVDHLGRLEARHGVYYIVGNHEYFHGIEDTIAYIKKLGLRVLENSVETLETQGGRLNVAGVYDQFGFRYGSFVPDIKSIARNVDAGAPTLLLAHQPRYTYNLTGFKPHLMLSGHTHGGQIWPFGYLVRLVQPYLKGLHKMEENSYIYVNSGIGFWGPPMRLGSSAEITSITWS